MAYRQEHVLLEQGEHNKPAQFFKWLVVELAPTIFGEKPATLLSFHDNRRLPLLTLWRKYGQVFLRQCALEWVILRETPRSLTVLFYHPQCMTHWLRHSEHCQFLAKFGYQPQCSLCENMACLKRRFQSGCPHEVGLLLGIPLKDVLGFMGLGKECLSSRKMWCIYGDPEPSLQLMEKIKKSKIQAAALLKQGKSPRGILLENCCKIA